MFQKLESELRETGNKRDKEIADRIALDHKLRGEDVPLKEVSADIVRFHDEVRATLEIKGYQVHTLTGQSIKTLKDAGRPFWSTWHKHHPDFEALQSLNSEVAIRPDQLFLPGSNNKTRDQQREMVAKFSEYLLREHIGLRAILGQVPDYSELAFTHLDATGNRLFGKDYGYCYTRTETPVGSNVASVGHFNDDIGLGVNNWRPGCSHPNLFAAPLIVPLETGQ